MGRQDTPWKYFALAAQAAKLKEDQRTFRLGAVGIRSDGVLVLASNGPVQSTTPVPAGHAEVRLCRKMNKHGTVFVVRLIASGYGLARPCPRCRRVLKHRAVSKVYYTISNDEYGVLEF